MSKVKIITFGETLRNLREETKMPLRKVAAVLDIDQSTLSKIERNERKPNVSMISQIAKIFNANKNDLLVAFYSDVVACEIKKEKHFSEILHVAEAKIEYQRTKLKKTK